MNRRGFLLAEETLKIVIALIALGFLAYFLASLYFSSQNSKKLEQAEATLSFLTTGIEAEQTGVEVYNPRGWSIMSWPLNGEIPLACSNLGWDSCICICKNPTREGCDKPSEGICQNNPEDLIVSCAEGQQCPIKIENVPTTLSIDYENKLLTQEG